MKSNPLPQLIYCYDPMCSWCWGFNPCWIALQEEIAHLVSQGTITLRPMLGGLAVDSDDRMPLDLQEKLQSVWKNIESQLGTKFNYDFWTRCQPRRSTYPACRACLVARDKNLESEIYHAIQQAYYLQARNPSNIDTLTECATQVGIHPERFQTAMTEVKASARLESEIQQARTLGLNSFPSLAVLAGNQITPITLDYKDPKPMGREILLALKASL